MSLQFANPAFLWGTLLAAVPIVIHLIHRRRARRVEFAAIAFVLRSQLRQARRLRLKRLLLLAARTLLALAVPLALAQPYLAPESAAAAPSRGPSVSVVVLDTSMSMRLRLGDETLFSRAADKAREIVDGLSPEDAVAVLPCADGPEGPLPTTTYDLAEAKQRVAQAAPGFRSTDMSACMAAAARVLSSSPIKRKRIYAVTDLAASGWRLDVPAPTVATEAGEVRPEIVVVDAADGEALPNRWVEDLQIEPAFALGPRGYAFAFTVRGAGGAAGEGLSATLQVGDAVLSRGFVELTADGTARKTLSHQFAEGGEIAGRVAVESDGLPEDDVRPFLTLVRRDLRALVVDGDPSVNRYEDEAFFVERALSPGRGAGSSIRPTLVDADGLATADLGAYDLVLLLDVHALPPGKAAELVSFVKNGGGLFVSAGDHLDPDAYNADLGELLPAALHVPKAAEGGAAALAGLDWQHPALGVFVGEGREGFASARFAKYLLTRPPHPDSAVLAQFEDGAPALLVRPFGRGRVALYTSTVDRDWTDLPIRTAFLPMMQQLSGHLARALDERRDATLPVGRSHTFAVPADAEEVVIVSPSGRTAGFKGDALSEGRITFDGTGEPGVYRVLVRRPGGDPMPAEGLGFVVVTDPRESDTTRIDPEELMVHLGGEITEDVPTVTASVGGDAGAEPLWSWLLLAAVLALSLEGWLLRR